MRNINKWLLAKKLADNFDLNILNSTDEREEYFNVLLSNILKEYE